MSNDALVLELSSNLQPVRRRSVTREALLVAAIAVAEAALIPTLGLMQHDMDQIIGAPEMAWKIASLGILALLASTVAMRSFSPTWSPMLGLKVVLGLIGAIVIVGVLAASSADTDRSLVDRISATQGIICAISIAVLAMPLTVVMAVAMHRAAPTHPESSALAIGIAGSTIGALIFTLCCPVTDPLYVMIWYGAACTTIVGISRWLLPWRYLL